MAPYSPAIGLPLGHESQAPLWPMPHKPKSKPSPLSLSSSNFIPHPKPTEAPSQFALKPRKLIYTPHIPHSSHARAHPADGDADASQGFLRRSIPGLSTAVFSVFLIMLIGLSSSMYTSHEHHGGREQSIVDMVRETYFDQGLPEPQQGYEYEQRRSIYVVRENKEEKGHMYMGMGLGYDFEKRDEDMSTSAAGSAPSAPASAPVPMLASASTTSSAAVASYSRAPPPNASASASKSTFHDPDDVRDPTAVKPDDDQPSMAPADNDNDAQNATPAQKRHWSSRNRPAKLGRRSF